MTPKSPITCSQSLSLAESMDYLPGVRALL
jgi:hypothetical protein